MTEGQLRSKLEETKNDPNIPEDEKKLYMSIYGADLERQRYDKIIAERKLDIESLRTKILGELLELKPTLEDEKLKKCMAIIWDLVNSTTTQDIVYTKELNLSYASYEIDSDSLTGQIAVYVDDNIQAELVELEKKCKTFQSIIDGKYMRMKSLLSKYIDPEVFTFETEEGYKQEIEYQKTFAAEDKKVIDMDISSKEKMVLRQILFDARRYGISQGTLYETLSDVDAYVDSKLNETSSSKAM